ncbi:MAG: hypothetical protein ACOCX4_10265, partial [Planctomycetota bacterium]
MPTEADPSPDAPDQTPAPDATSAPEQPDRSNAESPPETPEASAASTPTAAPEPASPSGWSRRRWLLGIGTALLATLVVTGWVVAGRLDRYVRNAVLEHGPAVTGTPVDLDAVSLSPGSGRFTLRGLVLHNPDGYPDTPPALAIQRAAAAVRPLSLLGDAPEVTACTANGVEVVCATGPGGSNWSHILNAVQHFLAQQFGPPPSDATGPEARPLPLHMPACTVENVRLRFRTDAAPDEGPTVTIATVEIQFEPAAVRCVATDIRITNPPGYSDRPAVTIGRLTVEIQPDSVLADRIVVTRVLAEETSALYETSVRGANFSRILAYVTDFVETMTRAEGQTSRPVTIRSFRVPDPSVRVSPSFTKGALQAPVPVGAIELDPIEADSISAAIRTVFQRTVPAFEGGAKGILQGLG